MEIDLPIRGLEPLQPLFAYLMIYVVALVFLRLVVWPNLLALRKRNLLGKILRVVMDVGFRLAVFGFLVLGFLWALSSLGLQDSFLGLLADLPDLPIGGLGLIIPGALILFLILIYFVIRPAFIKARKK